MTVSNDYSFVNQANRVSRIERNVNRAAENSNTRGQIRNILDNYFRNESHGEEMFIRQPNNVFRSNFIEYFPKIDIEALFKDPEMLKLIEELSKDIKC